MERYTNRDGHLRAQKSSTVAKRLRKGSERFCRWGPSKHVGTLQGKVQNVAVTSSVTHPLGRRHFECSTVLLGRFASVCIGKGDQWNLGTDVVVGASQRHFLRWMFAFCTVMLKSRVQFPIRTQLNFQKTLRNSWDLVLAVLLLYALS